MFKIVTYNIECGLQKEKLLENVKFFAGKGVSVFCLQEIRKNHNSDVFIGDVMLKTLGESWEVQYFLEPEYNGIGLALCIIWNSNVLKLLETNKIYLPFVGSLKLWETIFIKTILSKIEGKSWFTSIRRELKSQDLKRGALACVFAFGPLKLRILSTHLDWAGGEKQRLKQLDFLKDYLSASKIDLEVICGDFNALHMPFSYGRKSKIILEHLAQGFYDPLDNPKATARMFQRLDYLLVKGFKNSEAKVFNLNGSDHKPVIATLE